METVWFLVDYDLKATAQNYAERKRFYRAVHKLLGDTEFSSFSCYVTRDEQTATKFFGIAKQFAKRTHLYKAERAQ
jgi:predicted hotdog family 3-hydroxylacyl-ACP dehydratase